LKISPPLAKPYTTASSIKFDELQTVFNYEIVEYAYQSGNYTRSLYYALELLQQHPADPYLVTQVGRILNAMNEAHHNHTFGKFTELPSPYQPKQYNYLLQFIQNISREEYAALSYHFLKQFSQTFDQYEPFKNAFVYSSQKVNL
jgi:hypothetical protein